MRVLPALFVLLMCACTPAECGRGEDYGSGDDTYCFFRESIVIEGGFNCPASHPARTNTPAGTVCSRTSGGEPTEDWPADLCHASGLDGCPPLDDAGTRDGGPDSGNETTRYGDLDEAREDGLVSYIPFQQGTVVEHAGARATVGTPGRYDPGPDVGELGPVFVLEPGAGFFLPIDPTAGTQTFTAMFILAPRDRQPSTSDALFRASKQALSDHGQQLYFWVLQDPVSSEYRSMNRLTGEVLTVSTASASAAEGPNGAVYVFYTFDGSELGTWIGGTHTSFPLPVDMPSPGRDFTAFYIGGACDGGTCDGTGPGTALLSFAMWSRVLEPREMDQLAARGAEPVNPNSLPEL